MHWNGRRPSERHSGTLNATSDHSSAWRVLWSLLASVLWYTPAAVTPYGVVAVLRRPASPAPGGSGEPSASHIGAAAAQWRTSLPHSQETIDFPRPASHGKSAL